MHVNICTHITFLSLWMWTSLLQVCNNECWMFMMSPIELTFNNKKNSKVWTRKNWSLKYIDERILKQNVEFYKIKLSSRNKVEF